MKSIFLLSMLLMTVSSFAQSPQKMSYQCVVRNSAGALVANQSVGIKITILQGSASGTVVYQETYNPNPQTNANGLVTVEIGGGVELSGTFSAINWASGTYFLKTETDPTGGSNYTISGTSQLLSVPYALHAKTAENGFSGNYNDLSNKPTFFDGNWVNIVGKPTTLSGYGITDAMNTSHVTNGITLTLISNWNVAFGWGDHAGLYRPISYVPAWSEITGKPTTIAGFGITDAVTTTDNQTITGIKTFSNDILINGLTVGRGQGAVSSNTAVGFQALFSNTTGNNNTAIGYGADVSTGDLTNATAIGNNAVVNASNKIVLGNASATTVGGYGLWTNYSDIRLKENVTYDNKLGLNFITRLKPVTYNYINDSNNRKREGLIAQDVEKILEELGVDFSGLIIDDDSEKTMNLSYPAFVIPLITAVQEQQKQIEAQQKQIDELRHLVGLLGQQ